MGSLLTGIFFIALFATIIMSAILLYHWFQYGKYAINVSRVSIIYGLGVLLFLLLMASAI